MGVLLGRKADMVWAIAIVLLGMWGPVVLSR